MNHMKTSTNRELRRTEEEADALVGSDGGGTTTVGTLLALARAEDAALAESPFAIACKRKEKESCKEGETGSFTRYGKYRTR